MNIYIFYHANCYDGFGSAWVANKKFGKKAKYIAYKWEDALPVIENKSLIYFIDVSCPRQALIDLKKENTVIVIDHHKTTSEKLNGIDNVVFNISHSGAVLAWQYWFADKEIPLLLKYIEDRDLWEFKLERSEEVQAAIESYPMVFSVWDSLDVEQLKKEGEICLRLRNQQVQNICKECNWQVIGGYKIPVVNTSILFSECASELKRRYPDSAFSAYYFVRNDKKVQYGLRSSGEFDVSAVAKKYGGGGHKNSAGFICDALNC